MSIQKEQKFDMYFERVVWYSCYADCLGRVINEFIQNGESNLEQQDIPNLMEFLAKLTHRLHKNIMRMKSDWEFMD